MSNPVLVELTRGPLVESCHRGAVAIARADGGIVMALGDVERPILPRSAVKALQAVALVESGAADAMRFDDCELAVACASHSGARAHLDIVSRMLSKVGLDERALACGAHWPRDSASTRALIRSDRSPGPLHNNCSGKHAGMLALAVHLGVTPDGYERPDHPVQERIRETIASITEAPLGADSRAVDGCSVPTWALPLRHLAGGFARFVTGAAMDRSRAEACARLMRACFAQPMMVAGQGRFCTDVMTRYAGRAFVKVGAEGVYCAGFPEIGLGAAVKIDDGERRAAELVVAAVLETVLRLPRDALAHLPERRLTNWRGITVGKIATAPDLREALAGLAVG